MSCIVSIAVLANTNIGKHFVQTLTRQNETFVQLTKGFPLKHRVKKTFLFEDSLTECCELLQQTRKWTMGQLYVITKPQNPTALLKHLGADFVIYSQGKNVDFLIG